jgi:hypothetical protein
VTFAAIGQITVSNWAAAFLAIGFMIPIAIASLAGGYILAHFALFRVCQTTLGIRVRRWMTRHSPSKFFPEDAADALFVRRIVRQELRRG